MIRVILPTHLRTMAHVGSEVTLEVVILKTRPGHAPLSAGRVVNRKMRPTIPCCAARSRQQATTSPNSGGVSCLWPAPLRMRRRPLPQPRPTHRSQTRSRLVKEPFVVSLLHLSNTGMEPQPAWRLQIPISPHRPHPTTSPSDRT